MRKIVMLAALLLVFVAVACPAMAEEVVQDGVRYEVGEGDAVIIGFEPGVGTVVIPETINGKPTRAQQEYRGGLTNTDDVDTIIFAEGVDSIANFEVMLNMESLRRIEFPSTCDIKAEKEYASFDWVSEARWLTSIKLPANVTKEILEGMMSEIQEWYWYTTYEFKDYLNYEDWGLDPMDMDTAASRSLTHVEIAEGHPILYDIDGVVFEKGTDALIACPPGRTGVYDVPEGTKVIGVGAFHTCDQLTGITLPASVTRIEDGAFSLCAGMESIQLPPVLESIGDRAFRNCISLSTIILSEDVYVGKGAFDYCTGLRELICMGDGPDIEENALAKCPAELVVYSSPSSSAYAAAAINRLKWAVIGGEPALMPNPNLLHVAVAVIHDEDPSVTIPLYAMPGSTSELEGELAVGTTVDLLSTGNGWAHVATYTQVGYVPEDAVLMQPTDDPERILSIETIEPTMIYEGPSLHASGVMTESRDWFTVIQRFGTWYVIDVDGQAMYVPVSASQPCALNFSEDPIKYITSKTSAQRTELYKERSKDSECIAYLYNGTQVLDLEYGNRQNDGFLKVLVDGQEGYVANDSVWGVWDEYFYNAW